MNDLDFLRRLAQIETATIGHIRSEGFMTPDIQCLSDKVTVAGRALTVSLPGDDGSALPAALSQSKPGDVLVIERVNDNRHACWGAVMTAAAKAVGITGVIIDGYVTDVSAIRASGLPVWCKGRSPLTTKIRGGGTVGETISCGGVIVRRGDIVLGDENGVYVTTEVVAHAVVEEASAIQDREPAIIARLRSGESLAAIYGA